MFKNLTYNTSQKGWSIRAAFTWLISTQACKKKFPRINFQHSVSFSSAEYKYESHFFPSRPDFPKFYDTGLKVNKTGYFVDFKTFVIIFWKI